MTEGVVKENVQQTFQLVTAVGNLSMPPYDASKCTWKVYLQVFISKMKVHDMWSQYLLGYVGFEIVTLLTELCYPETLDDKDFEYIINKIERHIRYIKPKPSDIAKTYKFMQRVQEEGETILDFVAALKKLASRCNFQDYLNHILRDKFVHGLKNQSIAKRLFTEKDLTFMDAIRVATTMELGDKEAKLVGHVWATFDKLWAKL